MRQLPVVLLVVVVSSSAMLAQSSQSVSSQSVPRLINVSGVFQPANGQPAGAVETATPRSTPIRRAARPSGRRRRPSPSMARAATRCCSALPRLTAFPRRCLPRATPSGWAPCSSAPAKPKGRACGSPASRMRCARPTPTRSAAGPPPRTCSRRAPAARHGRGRRRRRAGWGHRRFGVTGHAELSRQVCERRRCRQFRRVRGPGHRGLMDGAVGMGTTTPLESPPHPLQQQHRRFHRPRGPEHEWRRVRLFRHAVLRPPGRAHAVPGLQQQQPRIPDQQHRRPAGSINFMLGGASKFNVASNGNIGIGTTAPGALLEVSNAVTGVPANMFITSYTNFIGPYYMSRRARGTAGAPTAVQTGDGLGGIYGEGYGTAFGSGFAGGMTVQAAQNWTNTAHGTALTFSTTPINATASATRMTLDASGNLGIGTTTVPAASLLEVSNASNSNTTGTLDRHHVANAASSLFVGRRARGTAARQRPCRTATSSSASLPKAMGHAFSGTRGGILVQRGGELDEHGTGHRLDFKRRQTARTRRPRG